MRANATAVLLLLLTVWAGILIGVSLIATPIKFQAPSLPLQTGAEIGRYTFRFLTRIELCLLIAVIVAAVAAQPRWITVVILAAVVVQIVLQRYWLLPILDQRVSQLLEGRTPPLSIHHTIYALMEAAKAALLIAGAGIEYSSHAG